MHRKINLLKGSRSILWFVTLFCYFFQSPFPFLARFIVPCLFAFILLESKNIQLKRSGSQNLVFFIYFLYISVILFLSIIKGNIITWAIRFYMILLAIPICFAIQDRDFETEEKVFFWLAIAKSIMLIGIAIAVLWTKNIVPFRQWARAQGSGDIYYADYGFIKIQVPGNPLLLVAFMLNYVKKKRVTWSNIILLLGVLAAGNFAFILGVVGFAAYQAGKKVILAGGTSPINKATIILAGIVGILVMIPFVQGQIQEKNTFSNLIRFQQAELLLDTNLLVGNGLGHMVVVNDSSLIERFGRYTYYYELQTLYIFNQIGSIGLLLFYVITIRAAYKKGRECFWIYLIYLFYSFWNPYCFDTTQMITIIAIINLKEIMLKGERTKHNTLYRREVATVNGN